MPDTAQLAFDFYGILPNPDILAAEADAAEAAYDEMVVRRVVTLAEAKEHGIYRLYESCPGNRVTVLVCPACGEWEANDWLIGNNHGIHLHDLERRDDGTWDTGRYGPEWCTALELTSHHVAGNYELSDSQILMIDCLRPDMKARFGQHVAETRKLIDARRSA